MVRILRAAGDDDDESALENVTQGQNEIDLHHRAKWMEYHIIISHQHPAGNKCRRLSVGNGDPVAPNVLYQRIIYRHERA